MCCYCLVIKPKKGENKMTNEMKLIDMLKVEGESIGEIKVINDGVGQIRLINIGPIEIKRSEYDSYDFHITYDYGRFIPKGDNNLVELSKPDSSSIRGYVGFKKRKSCYNRGKEASVHILKHYSSNQLAGCWSDEIHMGFDDEEFFNYALKKVSDKREKEIKIL